MTEEQKDQPKPAAKMPDHTLDHQTIEGA